MNHDDLAYDLAKHLAVDGKLIWCDMQIGPQGSPRPDVFTLRKSFVNPAPSAYECKVSVSDFRADITEGKWQSYLAFAGAVTFAVPVGLVKVSDIPTGCGFMTRSDDGKWHTHRRATRQMCGLKVEHLMKLLIDGWGYELGQRDDQRRRVRDRLADDKISKKHGKEVADVVRDIEQARRMVDHYRDAGEKQRAFALSDAESIRATQKKCWDELSAIVGLPPDSGRWDIERAVRALNKPSNDENLLAALRSLRNIADDAIREAVHGK